MCFRSVTIDKVGYDIKRLGYIYQEAVLAASARMRRDSRAKFVGIGNAANAIDFDAIHASFGSASTDCLRGPVSKRNENQTTPRVVVCQGDANERAFGQREGACRSADPSVVIGRLKHAPQRHADKAEFTEISIRPATGRNGPDGELAWSGRLNCFPRQRSDIKQIYVAPAHAFPPQVSSPLVMHLPPRPFDRRPALQTWDVVVKQQVKPPRERGNQGHGQDRTHVAYKASTSAVG